MVQHNNDLRLEQSGGGGHLEKSKTIVSSIKHVSYIYLCEQLCN